MNIFLAPVVVSVIGLIIVMFVFQWIKKQPAGTDVMKNISGEIHKGAMTYLKQQYYVLSIFLIIVFLLLTFFLPQQGLLTAVAFVFGGICSLIAGFIGMNAATMANVR